MSRGLKMLAMLQSSSHSYEKGCEQLVLVKVLEFNDFCVYERRKLLPTSIANVYGVTFKGKSCRAVIIISGDNPLVLERHIGEIKLYESVLATFKNLEGISVGIQACTETESTYVQTDRSTTQYQPNMEHDSSVLPDPEEEEVFAERLSSEDQLPELDSIVDIVESSGQPLEERRRHSKKQHFCKFCRVLVANFRRHLLVKHKDEEETITYTSLHSRGEKIKKMSEIMAQGDSLYNERNPQAMIVRRESLKPGSSKERMPCPNCKAMVSKLNLTRHFSSCSSEGHAIRPKFVKRLSARVQAKQFSHMSESFQKNVWPFFRSDDVKKFITSDKQLIGYGNKLCLKYSADDQSRYIRQVLRSIARISIQMTESDTSENRVKESLDFFCPQKYELFVESVRNICKAGEGEGGGYKSPAVVSQYAGNFRKYSDFIMKECIMGKVGDESNRKKIKDWQRLFDSSFNTEVGAQARKQSEMRTGESRSTIPLSSDVKLLSDYISNLANSCYEKLKVRFKFEDHLELGKALLIKLWLFNRKRVAEVDRLRVADWLSKSIMDTESDAYRGLSTSEKLFSTSFKRITVRGKLNRRVGLLLHVNDEEKFELYIKLRAKANVLSSNPYLFAVQNSYLEGTRIMRDMSTKCGAKRPELLRGTKLRKHFATMVQCLNLTDEDLNQVAKSLGHTDKTHIAIYRSDQRAIHMGRISKLLVALDQNKIEQLQNKSLTSLELEENEDDEVLEEEDETNITQTPWDLEPDEEKIGPSLEVEPQPGTSKAKTGRARTPSEESYRPKDDGESSEYGDSPKKIPGVGDRKRRFARRSSQLRQRWETPIKNLVWQEFRQEISAGKLPAVSKCKLFIEDNKDRFSNRTPDQLKAFIYNMCKKIAKTKFSPKKKTNQKIK